MQALLNESFTDDKCLFSSALFLSLHICTRDSTTHNIFITTYSLMNPKVASPGWTETSESETSFPPYVVTWFHRCPILKLLNSAPHFYAVLHSQAFTQWYQYWYFYHHFTRKISPNGTLSQTVLLTLLMQQTCMEYEDAIHQHSHA